jgi:hypothetical protein
MLGEMRIRSTGLLTKAIWGFRMTAFEKRKTHEKEIRKLQEKLQHLEDGLKLERRAREKAQDDLNRRKSFKASYRRKGLKKTNNKIKDVRDLEAYVKRDVDAMKRWNELKSLFMPKGLNLYDVGEDLRYFIDNGNLDAHPQLNWNSFLKTSLPIGSKHWSNLHPFLILVGYFTYLSFTGILYVSSYLYVNVWSPVMYFLT